MKVGCQQCGASYSVADEKVAGRKLKLRCKKCGEPMVIDASAQDSIPFGPAFQIVTPEASGPPPAPPQSEWFVAVDDQPQGPYTLPEIQAHYAAGLIARDALVFREGLSEWTRAQDVPELQARMRRPSAAPPPPPSAPHARSAFASAGAADGEVAMGRDPFADSVPPFSAPYSPRVSAEELLAGPPRDGTVQFSLDDIRALSAMSAPSVAPAAPSRPGYAGGDGSGLIDVRSLSESAPPPDTFRSIGTGGLQASPLDTMAPFALPARAQRGGVDFRTKVLAGVASFGFLLAGAIGVFALTRTSQPQAAVVPIAGEALPRAAAAAVTGAPRPAVAAAALPGASPPLAAAKPQAQAEREPAVGSESAAEPAAVDRPVKNRRRGARAAAKSDAPERTAAKPKSARATDIDDILAKPAAKDEPATDKTDKPSADKPSASKGGDDLDALLLGALDGKKAAAASKPATAEPAEKALPKTPSRDEMLASLGKAKAKAAKCKGTGVATANITIANSGRVSSVSVSGVEGGSKSCVENAVRTTSFPKFQQPTFAVKFPFKLGG